MALHQHQHHHHRSGQEPQSSRSKWIMVGFLAVAVFFLLTEHRAHVYGALPYLLLLACPLMHFFHGHGHHGSHSGKDRNAHQMTDTGGLSAKDNAVDAPADRKGQS